MKLNNIEIINAKENNLKNINVNIPLIAFTCITGVSGCGKSSLVYDTLYAESQREFFESMSGNLYGQKIMDKPLVDKITNLRPALNVAQNYYNYNPRSTVGTLTDISYYLRTLYALISNYEQKTSLGENYFSSNNPSCFCKKCYGLGEEYVISEELVIPNKEKTLKEGAILYFKGKNNSQEMRLLEAICEKYDIDMGKRFCDLSKQEVHKLLYEKKEECYNLKFKTPKGRYKNKEISTKGVMLELEEKLLGIDTPSVYAAISKYLIKDKCSGCKGKKLKKEVLDKKIHGYDIADVEAMKICDVENWLLVVLSEYQEQPIFRQVKQLYEQIVKRTQRILQLKVGYISLDRAVPTLSGGEIQRIRISNQLNCSLRDLIYILDEPCKGLHFKDINCIVSATNELVKNGNTVVAIEHNKQYISRADKVIELGPVGGPHGGYIVSEKRPNVHYKIEFSTKIKGDKFVEFEGINYRNINNQNIKFPIGGITCITGVSGSGKSTLVEVINNSIEKKKPWMCINANNIKSLGKVYRVNQNPIGKTPRSTVISYLEIYEIVRDIFANTKEAKKLKLKSSDFSMNVKGGRCECCQGTGIKKMELTYLPDSFIVCPECEGKRFNDEVLSVKYKSYSIDDILDIPIEELINIFEDSNINEKLDCMVKIGLGYIKLGQMSMNLSGGEAQRVKLAKALGSKKSGKNIYILDEPTSGLNDKDIDNFAKIVKELRDGGETVLIIEHNIEFVAKYSDYVIDFGNYAGSEGGVVVAQDIAENVFDNPKSSWFGYSAIIN